MTAKKPFARMQNCSHCAFWDLDGWGYSRPCVLRETYKEADGWCKSFQHDARFGGPTPDDLKAFVDAAVGGR
jgi:hypothetical protein